MLRPEKGDDVSKQSERHPEVVFTLLLPYLPYERPVPIQPGLDGNFYPPGIEGISPAMHKSEAIFCPQKNGIPAR